MGTAVATLKHQAGDLTPTLEFLKRTRWELRILRRVHTYKDKIHIIDVNNDYFEITDVGYADADAIRILRAVNTAFDHLTLHEPPAEGDYKEFGTGRRHTWAEDRVM